MFGKRPIWFTLWNILGAILLSMINIGFIGVPSTNAAPSCDRIPFNPSNFSNPTTIDNKYLPLVPGIKLILEGTANRGEGAKPHRVIFIVTDLTKVINGVRTVVVFDRDIQDEQIVESELAFFAQDNDGNVWNLGEYPEESVNGEFIGAPSTWIAGLAGAEGGIHMYGGPKVGQPRYSQGYAPDIEFLDCARIIRKNIKVRVPSGNYNNVLLIDEVSPFDRKGGHQRKYHAPGVGIIQIGAVGDPEAETLSLVKFVQLEPEEWEEIRAAVLEMDHRGYTVSPDVYGQTTSIEHMLLP
jgi:hypothetical protein